MASQHRCNQKLETLTYKQIQQRLSRDGIALAWVAAGKSMVRSALPYAATQSGHGGLASCQAGCTSSSKAV